MVLWMGLYWEDNRVFRPDMYTNHFLTIGIALITAAQSFSRYYPRRGYFNILKYYPGWGYFGISKYYSGLGYFGIFRYYPGRGYFSISFGTAVGPVLEQRKKWCTDWCTLCQLLWIHWILVFLRVHESRHDVSMLLGSRPTSTMYFIACCIISRGSKIGPCLSFCVSVS